MQGKYVIRLWYKYVSMYNHAMTWILLRKEKLSFSFVNNIWIIIIKFKQNSLSTLVSTRRSWQEFCIWFFCNICWWIVRLDVALKMIIQCMLEIYQSKMTLQHHGISEINKICFHSDWDVTHCGVGIDEHIKRKDTNI